MPGRYACQLLQRIRARTAKIGVIGLGYVGLPLALRFAQVGMKVLGIDVDTGKIRSLRGACSYLRGTSDSEIAAALAAGFQVSTTLDQCGEADAIIICVPTPLTESREPDLSILFTLADALGRRLRAGQLVALESTTYPGTTEDELRPRLARSNLKVGEQMFLVYSPERTDPADRAFGIKDIPKLVSGVTPACLELGVALYRSAVDKVVEVSSTQAAELAKLFENVHRAVNIGLVNELKIIADRMGVDIFEITEIAGTKPFGFASYFPGPGLGGHCIPVDPVYLLWKARQLGVRALVTEAAAMVNASMPDWVVQRTVEALRNRGQSITGSRILVLGIAYKKNIDDVRESPGLAVIEKLQTLGALVEFSDPYVAEATINGRIRKSYLSVDLTSERLASANAVVLVADHDLFDYAAIADHSQLIIDTRGRYKASTQNVVRA